MHFAGINELINQGWPISEERLAEFFGEKQFDDPSKLRQTLLDSDIREYGVTVLMDRVDYRIGELKGPVVVQISKLLNVSCSKLSQSSRSGSDGLYKIQLTDGHSTINAVQFDPIPTLTIETPPGTKLLLIGTVPLESGLVLINVANCRVLGGSVTKLIERWKLEKSWSVKQVRNVNSSAPKWVPFTKRIQSTSNNMKLKTFCANDVLNNKNLKKSDEQNDENDEFGTARKAQIQQAIAENANRRKFAASQIKLKIPVESTRNATVKSAVKKETAVSNFSETRQNNDQRKNRRSNRAELDEEALLHQRPSQPSTLFDFIQQSAVPATSDSAPTNLKSEAIAPTKPYPQQFGKPNTSSPPPLSASRGGVRGGGGDGGGPGNVKNFGRGFNNRGNSRGFTANRGNRGGAQMSNSNRSRGGYQGNRDRRDVTSANAFSGSPQNDRFVLNNDGSFPPLNPQNQKQSSVNTITNGMSGMDLNTKSSTSSSAAMDRSTSSNRYTNKPYDTYSNNKPSYNDSIGASNKRGNDRFNNDAIPSSNQPSTYTKTNSNYQSAGTRYEQGQQSQPQQRILHFNRSYNNDHYNYGPPSSSPMPYNGGQKSNSPKFSTRTGLPIWKVGDKCLAPWSDGQLYVSTVVSMGPADMCCIQYDGYGNRSSVPIGCLIIPPQ